MNNAIYLLSSFIRGIGINNETYYHEGEKYISVDFGRVPINLNDLKIEIDDYLFQNSYNEKYKLEAIKIEETEKAHFRLINI